MGNQYLLLDIGGTGVKYGLMDSEFHWTHKGVISPFADTREQYVERFSEILDGVRNRISGIGISTCGQFDPNSGMVFSMGQYPFWKGRSIKKELEEVAGLPITFINDANSALLAEMVYGCLKDERNGAVMVIGSGIGGGIMIDRKIYAGEHFCSGELSLLRVSDSYQIDSAFLVSGGIGGLQRQVQRATGNNESLSGHEIFSRVNAGNPDACEALDRYCADFAIQIYNLQAILDLNVIAIGGGISAQPILIERLRKKVQDIYAYEAQFQAPPRMPNIVSCQFHNDANLVGAYVALMESKQN